MVYESREGRLLTTLKDPVAGSHLRSNPWKRTRGHQTRWQLSGRYSTSPRKEDSSIIRKDMASQSSESGKGVGFLRDYLI